MENYAGQNNSHRDGDGDCQDNQDDEIAGVSGSWA